MLAIPLLLAAQLFEPLPVAERLSNGLRIVIVEDHAVPLVSVQVWYRTGAAVSSSAFAAAIDRVRRHVARRDHVERTRSAQGFQTASHVLPDAVVFTTIAPSAELQTLLETEARRMRLIEDGALPGARENADARDASTRATPDPALLQALFPDHPYGRLAAIALDRAGVSDPPARQARLLKAAADLFVPTNATLVVVGDVSQVTVLEQIRSHFADLPWAEPPHPPLPERPPTAVARVGLQGDGGEMAFAWVTSPLGFFENAAIDVLMARLCNPIDGPLYRALQQSELIADDSGALNWRRWAWREGGALVVEVDLRPRTGITPRGSRRAHEQVETLVLDALKSAKEEAASPIEHNRARAIALRRLDDELTDFAGRSDLYGQLEVVAGDVLLAEYARERIDRVAVGDVQAAADQLLTARRIVGVRSPKRSDAPPSSQPGEMASDRFTSPAPPPAADSVPTATRGISILRTSGLTVCTLPEGLDAAVLTLWDDPLRPVLGAASWPTPLEKALPDARDYYSYHGIIQCTVYDEAGGGAVGLLARVSAERLPAALEWHTRALRARLESAADGEEGEAADTAGPKDRSAPADTPARIRTVVVSPVDADTVAGLVRKYGPRPHTVANRAGSGTQTRTARHDPAPSASPADAAGRTASAPGAADPITPGRSTGPALTVRLAHAGDTSVRIAVEVVNADPRACPLAARVLRRLLGLERTADRTAREGAQEWSRDPDGPGRLSRAPKQRQVTDRRGARDFVAGLLERVSGIEAAASDAEVVARAVRAAQAERVIALDDPTAIALALIHQPNPWALDSPGAVSCFRQALPGLAVEVTLECNADAREELRVRVESLPGVRVVD